MRAAISLLVLLLSMCGVQTDVSTELKELRDMVVELKGRHVAIEAENAAMSQRLAVSEYTVQALEQELQDTKVEMKTEVDNLKKENAAQEAELAAVKTRLAATETEVENLEKEIRAAPKVAFSAALGDSAGGLGGGLNLVFQRVITNVGEAYSSTTGFFTAPVRGVYYFRFTVEDVLDSRIMSIRMHKNGERLMQLVEYDTDGQPSYLSSGLALQLEKGDTVNMVIPADYRLFDNSAESRSTFSGFLLFPL
ncbi:cerebellin-3-like [Engraulis encrasicolus]|uniref:cerebellin-3-like n=1 Tax=Engraulis encrasicolus TaxID=184585 RepID=UPI002FD78594